jgi:hypothetical protein
VALAIVLVFDFVQQRATPSPRQTAAQEPAPTSTVWVQPTLAPLPSNWTHILPGFGFTEGAGSLRMVASVARPGRIAGCALPSTGYAANPQFVLSDDGGRAWLTLPIPILGEILDCMVLADTRRPDTFIIGAMIKNELAAVVTLDAGHTWRFIQTPSQAQVFISNSPGFGGNVLADGRLVTTLFTAQDGRDRLAETRVDVVGAEWRMLDERIPFSASEYCKCVTTYAVDYANPAHIYIAIYADQSDLKAGITIYETSDSGASWRLVRNWPGSQRLALWTTLNGNLYVNDQRVPGSMEGKFYLSSNHGVTWTEIKLPPGNEGLFFVGISGQRVITTIGSEIYLYTTATGVFTLIGSLPDLWYGGGVGDRAGIIVDSSSPAFIATSRWETAIRALP